MPNPRRMPRPSLRLEVLEDRTIPAVGISPIDQEALFLINRMRTAPAEELPILLADPQVNLALNSFNVNRTLLQQQWNTLSPAPPVTWNDNLAQAALNHTNLMVALDIQSHQLPGEPGLGTRASNAGYTGWNALGENIFLYGETAFYNHAAFAIDWGGGPNGIQDPPGHRINIMSTSYREVGIGHVYATKYQGNATTHDFGRRNSFGFTFLVGSVYYDRVNNDAYDSLEGLGDIQVEARNTGTNVVYTTTTGSAGGYQVAVPPGTYQVTFSGGPLTENVVRTATVGSANRLLNLEVDAVRPVAITYAGLSASEVDLGGTVDLQSVVVMNDPARLHTVTIDWGDGSVPTQLSYQNATLPVRYLGYAGSNPIRHQYNALPPGGADRWTVTITLSDGTTSESVQRTVFMAGVPPEVGFATAANAGVENQPGSIAVTLSRAVTYPVTVPYTLAGTATPGVDYKLANGTVTFAPGQTTRTLNLNIVNDTRYEGDETIIVNLGAPTGATLGELGTHTYTILDNDPMPVVNFQAATSSVTEGNRLVNLVVLLSAPAEVMITVDYSASGGTATANADFNLPPGSITFAPGQTRQTLAVQVLDDIVDEWNETVDITLINPLNATVGTRGLHRLTIVDNDPIPRVNFSSAAASVDEDGEPMLEVRLSSVSERPVTALVSASGTAKPGVDFVWPGTLTLVFAPGTTALPVPITLIDDALDELNERVAFRLSGSIHGSLGTPNVHTLTILDNDDPPLVRFSQVAYSVLESVGLAVIEVMLDTASALPVTVRYATRVSGLPGEATANSDFRPASGTLKFAPGQTVARFTVAIINDRRVEDDETIELRLTAATNARLDVPTPDATFLSALLTIEDNDELPQG